MRKLSSPYIQRNFGLALPRRIRGLNLLIDDAVARGVSEKWVTTKAKSGKNLIASPQREGYGRHFRFTSVTGGLFLCVNYGRWATSGDTPLWFWIGRDVSVNFGKLRSHAPSLVQEKFGYDVPIHLQTGIEYEGVVEDVVRQLRAIADMIDKP